MTAICCIIKCLWSAMLFKHINDNSKMWWWFKMQYELLNKEHGSRNNAVEFSTDSLCTINVLMYYSCTHVLLMLQSCSWNSHSIQPKKQEGWLWEEEAVVFRSAACRPQLIRGGISPQLWHRSECHGIWVAGGPVTFNSVPKVSHGLPPGVRDTLTYPPFPPEEISFR